MVEIVNKNKEIVGDTINWQTKYQELLHKYNALSQQKSEQTQNYPPSAELTAKLEILEKQLIEVRNNYNKAIQNSQ